MIALTVLALVAIGVLLYLMTAQAASFETERREWARERAQLLNRIKPETAQPVIGEPEWPSPRSVVDDDEAFWAARGIDTSEVR